MAFLRKLILSVLGVGILGAFLATTEPGDGFGGRAGKTDAKAADPAPACKGLKKSITVYRLEDRISRVTSRQGGGYYGGYGGRNAYYSDTSNALTDMLMTTLQSTGCFLVVERENLSDIEREQSLVQAGKTKATGAANPGNLIAAQVIVMGAVTSFEEHSRGGALGGITRGGRVGGLATDKAKVGIDLRLVDSTTGEVLDSAAATGDASSTAIVVGGIPVGNIKIGTALWQKTPLGNASREAITKAVHFIVTRMKNEPWAAKVAQVNGDKIYINAGQNAGLKVGESYFVYSAGEAITDPDTGAVLGAEETKIAVIDITEVNEKYSVAKVTATFKDGSELKRGDLVREH